MTTAASAELMFRPVDELAALVRSGELSSRELVQTSLDRIEALNPQVNAFVDVFAEEALAAADAIRPGDERPFAGVPVAVKNNVPLAGKRFTLASQFMGDFVAPFDHNVVTRLRDRGGAIVVGTTMLPEFGIQPSTETRRFGATRNPWDPGRTAGGSSGGSAAAVAAGMVPFAHANDGGGSTRIPAACCGLVGLKAQRGRVSQAPAIGEQFLSIDGVVTRTVRETALALDVLSGPEPGDASWAPPPAQPFAGALAAEPQGLRIGLMLDPPLPDTPLDPECAGAARAASELLEQLGHTVVELQQPPMDGRELFRMFTAVFGPMCCSQVNIGVMVHGRQPTIDDVEGLTLWLWELCQGINSVDAYSALIQMQGIARMIVGHMAQVDVVLTPALAEAPLELGILDPDGPDPSATFARAGKFTPYTAAMNITGSPAVSVPLYQRDDGLPLGIQLCGQPAGEAQLLALAAQLEAANPWTDRRPAVS
jgi:amidase